MEKFVKNFISIQKKISFSEYLIYNLFPLTQEKRVLLKALQEIKESTKNCIVSIIYYEHFQKKITISKKPSENFRIFVEKCAKKYGINEKEIKEIKELFKISEEHKKSPLEFIKNDKIIILSEKMKTFTLTKERIQEFLELSKDIFEKTRKGIQGKV